MTLIVLYSGDMAPFNYLSATRWIGPIGTPYPGLPNPSDYLQFAIDDLRDGQSDRHCVNAFGNIKRSLHLTIDSLLHQYGLFRYAKRLNFPDRLALINAIGVLPTSIINNLNVERNLVEHEYSVPERRRVEEAIDVGRLLDLAISRLLERTPIEFVVGWNTPRRHSVMRLEPDIGQIMLHRLTARGRYRTLNGVRYFAGPLRSFADDRLMPDISIADNPWRVITINKSSEDEWKFILSEIVQLQMGNSFGGEIISSEGHLITTSITFPMHDPPGKTMSQRIDEAMKSKAEVNRAMDDSNRSDNGEN